MAERQIPKDAAKRLELKQELQERMRQSIVEQGSYGIRRTAIWMKTYARASRFMKREFPTQATLRKLIKLIKQIDEVHKWSKNQHLCNQAWAEVAAIEASDNRCRRALIEQVQHHAFNESIARTKGIL